MKMLMDYFSLPHCLEHIEKVSQHKKDGLSNTDLVDTLEKLGLKVKAKANAKWADLRRGNVEGKVIVVSWMMSGYIGYFSVVDAVDKDFIYLADSHEG